MATRVPRHLPLAFAILSSFSAVTSNTASAVTLLVTECDDGAASGTLRHTIGAAPDNSIVQIPLKCSKITLTQGSIKVPNTLNNIYIVGQSPSETIIDGGRYADPNVYDRVFRAYNLGVLGLTDLTITDAAYFGVDPRGGCIFSRGDVGLNNAVVTHCQILAAGINAPSKGGGIFALGTVALLNSQVTENYALASAGQTSQGGGIYALLGVSATSSTISGNIAGHGNGGDNSDGGAFYAGAYGPSMISKSTISGNVADRNSALHVIKVSGLTGSISIVSSTIADNVAHEIQTVGTYVPTTVTNSTIAYNRAQISNYDEPAGLYSTESIVANNSIIASNGSVEGVTYDVYSSAKTYPLSGSKDLITSSFNTLPTGTLVSCPGLGHLSNNGGPTQTIPLLAASPALDVGAANSATTDQRGTGFPRTAGAGTDIGAYERQWGVVDDVIFFSEFDSRCN